MKEIMYKNNGHAVMFKSIIARCEKKNSEIKSVMYLLALVCENERQVEDCFNFNDSHINLKGMNSSWQTGESMRATKLAFNLWNGCNGEATVYAVFGSGLDKYFIEAIRLRFGI